ncbi:MAG TPA: hypothetical protein VFO16_21280, partial [Pseudonocardiaceae bacterium]|nr:hypothetical protein [Pseudonocardiaceae bacterium]
RALTADLPTATPDRLPRAGGKRRRPQRRRRNRRGLVRAWASVSVLNLVIWAIVSLTTLHWVYPWWVWVAGPWGAMLLMGWLSGRGEAGRGPV